MFRVLPSVFFLLAVGLAGCSGGGGGSESAANSDACSVIGLEAKVIGGTACSVVNRSAVVRLGLIRGDGSFAPFCSASIIGSRAVLTASHCFIPFEGVAARNFGVAIGEIGSLRIIRASALSLFPGLIESQNRLFNDLAVMTLETDVGITPLAILSSRTPTFGESGAVFGYGKRREGENTSEPDLFFNLVSGRMLVETVTPNHLFVSYDGSGANVCNGDSGGPLLLESPQGGFAIAGVVSVGSIAGCRAGDITTFTNATSEQFLSFISEKAAGVSFR